MNIFSCDHQPFVYLLVKYLFSLKYFLKLAHLSYQIVRLLYYSSFWFFIRYKDLQIFSVWILFSFSLLFFERTETLYICLSLKSALPPKNLYEMKAIPTHTQWTVNSLEEFESLVKFPVSCHSPSCPFPTLKSCFSSNRYFLVTENRDRSKRRLFFQLSLYTFLVLACF